MERETWLLGLSPDARVGSFEVGIGDAIFVQSDRVDIHAGPTGMVGLAAYTGSGPVPHLLQRVAQPAAMDEGPPRAVQVPTFLSHAMQAPPTDRRLGVSR